MALTALLFFQVAGIIGFNCVSSILPLSSFKFRPTLISLMDICVSKPGVMVRYLSVDTGGLMPACTII